MPNPFNATEERYLRRPDVELVTGLSRSTIYEMMNRGEFPRPAKLGRRAVGWKSSKVIAWMSSRVETTGGVCPKATPPSQ